MIIFPERSHSRQGATAMLSARNCSRPGLLRHLPTAGRAPGTGAGAGRIVCFREDDGERGFETDQLRWSSGSVELSSWGRAGLVLKHTSGIRQSCDSNIGGNGSNGGKGRGGRPGDNSEKKRRDSSSFAVTLLLTFSALHLGYCIAAWMRKDGGQLGIEFYGLGLGLVCLLAASAVFLSLGVASDAYFLGLWACLAALIATGETWFVHKHGRWSGFTILFGIASVTMCGACNEHL